MRRVEGRAIKAAKADRFLTSLHACVSEIDEDQAGHRGHSGDKAKALCPRTQSPPSLERFPFMLDRIRMM